MTCSLCILLGFSRYKILFFSIFILSRQSFLCHDRSFLGSLTNCLARSVVLSILCRDNLMCDYWNSYVATLTIVSRPSFYVATAFLLVLVATMFLILSAFLSRPDFISNKTFLYSAHLCVTTQFVMSRQDLSSLSENLYRDIEKSVATLFICFQLIFVSRP